MCIFRSTASHACTKCLHFGETCAKQPFVVFYRENFLHICLTCIKHTHTHRYTKTQGSSCFFDAKHPCFQRYPTNPQKDFTENRVLCRIAEVIPLRCVRFILCLGLFGGVKPLEVQVDQTIRGWSGLDHSYKGFAILPMGKPFGWLGLVGLNRCIWKRFMIYLGISPPPQAGCNRGKWRFCSGFPSKHVIITSD